FYIANLGADLQSCGTSNIELEASFDNQTPENFSWTTSGTGQIIPDTNDPVHFAMYLPSDQDVQNGSFQIIYVSNTPCGNVSDTVVVSLLNSPETHFRFDTVTICNQPEYGSILNVLNILEPNNLPG